MNGEDVAVPDVPHFECPKCGEQILTYTQARRFEEDAIALYRKKYGLLSGDEIRAIREQHNGRSASTLPALGRRGVAMVAEREGFFLDERGGTVHRGYTGWRRRGLARSERTPARGILTDRLALHAAPW